MYTPQACSVVNSQTPYNPGRAPARRARLDTATNAADAAYKALLCRNPWDFLRFGRNVAKDVQAVNAATGCGPAVGTPSGAIAAPVAGDPVAGGLLAALLSALSPPASSNAGTGTDGSPNAGAGGGSGPGGNAGSGGGAGSNGGSGGGGGGRQRGGGRGPIGARGGCDLSGGVNVVPLNGPGSGGLPDVSAAPAQLTTPYGLPYPGLGSCTDFPAWGDAFPNGAPAATSVGSAVWGWISANPWLTAALVAGGAVLLSQNQKGKRG